MAHFSKDEALTQAFVEDEDVHRETAARIFSMAPEKVGPDERRRAKAINFGVIYGQGPFGLAKTLKISQGMAKDFIEKYFARFPKVKVFMEETKKKAHRLGYVETLFGRVRYLPDIRSQNHRSRSEAERMAINTPIQGTAADLIKIAMLRVDRRLKKEGLMAQIILQVHDELIAEAPDAECERVKEILEEEMILSGKEEFYPGAPVMDKVPLKVDSVISQNWKHA
jgi:DNA polymerase-1